MICCHIPLISREINPKYKDYLVPIDDSHFLMTLSNTDQKCLQLIAIKNKLNLNIKIEMGCNFVATTNIGIGKRKKRLSEYLLVTFEDGTSFGGLNQMETFMQVIDYIGINKIIKAHIQISGKPLITSTKQYNNQQQMNNGQWLTIPSSTKDKYKNLRVIAAMVHLKMEIMIV